MDAISYFLINSGLLIFFFALMFFFIGIWGGWYVWGKNLRENLDRIHPLEQENSLLKDEIRLCEDKINTLINIDKT